MIEYISKNEGKTLEFKKDLSNPQKILETIIAFANTSGGTIVIGIEDKTKNLIGITDILNEEERLSNIIFDSILPHIFPEIEIRNFENREFLVVKVFPGERKPYYLKAKGTSQGTYIRLGSSNRKADKNFIEQLKIYSRNLSYDELCCYEMNYLDIDFIAIKNDFKKNNKTITNVTLKNLSIIKEENGKQFGTIAGFLMYSSKQKEISDSFPVKCIKFKGKDRTSIIIDQVEYAGNFINILEYTMKFIKNWTKLSSKIEGLKRIDIPEYPEEILRELIVNMLVHSDYSIKGINISIAIFDDRIEFNNPGMLPFGLRIEDLFHNVSRIRNKVIARIFKELNLIEQWGTGIQKITKWATSNNKIFPKFEELGTFFRATIYNTSYDNKKEKQKKMDDDQKIIIDYLQQNKSITTDKATRLIGKTKRTVRLKLKKLVDTNILIEIKKNDTDPLKHYILYPKKIINLKDKIMSLPFV